VDISISFGQVFIERPKKSRLLKVMFCILTEIMFIKTGI